MLEKKVAGEVVAEAFSDPEDVLSAECRRKYHAAATRAVAAGRIWANAVSQE